MRYYWYILFNLLFIFSSFPGGISSVQFSRTVMSDSLRPHELQHARPPCPSPTPGVHSDSCPSSQWCHPAISSSVVPFSAPNPSQHQSPFQWVNSSHEVARVLEFQLWVPVNAPSEHSSRKQQIDCTRPLESACYSFIWQSETYFVPSWFLIIIFDFSLRLLPIYFNLCLSRILNNFPTHILLATSIRPEIRPTIQLYYSNSLTQISYAKHSLPGLVGRNVFCMLIFYILILL